MFFKRLKSCEGNLYNEAMQLYQLSFPYHEQRKPFSQAAIMENENYHFYLICEEDKMVGIMLCWETETFIYVEHFCINPAMRNKKYGQKALELLNQRGKTVILEIDPPIDEIAIRRKGFYERAGYQANRFEHIHPPYQEGHSGHSLMVMSYPKQMTEAVYDDFNRCLKLFVMAECC